MAINISVPTNSETPELKPRITVIGVGGAGGNAVNNMIDSGLEGVEFLVVNSDSQALQHSKAERRLQMGVTITQGLGAGSNPDIGSAAAEESLAEIMAELTDCNMVFITAGLGGGSGTGGAPVIARAAREHGILTVGVVTKPFQFEGAKRMKIAEAGLEQLQQFVDTLLIIPNQNLFRVANENTTFADAFKMADDVLYSGVRGVTDLMVMPGLINLDFADIRSVMGEMGKAMMGTGEAEGERRAIEAAEAAIANPLLDDTSMAGARGVLINITAGSDITLFEVDEAANRIRDEVDSDANIIFGSTFDESVEGKVRVSVVATGIESVAGIRPEPIVRRVTVATATEAAEANDEAAPVEPMAAAPVMAFPAPVEPITAEPEVEEEAIQPAAEIVAPEIETPDAPIDEPELIGESDDVPAAPAAAEAAEAAFIPAPPADSATGATSQAKANPFAAADMVNAGGESETPAPQPKSAQSLFERVTGVARPERKSATISEPAQPVIPEPEPVPESPAEPPIEPAAPLLGGVNSTDRLQSSQEEEDLLDIPAFLRRQAN